MPEPVAHFPQQIVVELDSTGPPISGRLNPASSIEARPFTGWLSLLSAMSAAIDDARAGSNENTVKGRTGE